MNSHALQHIQIQYPFFFTSSFEEASETGCPLSQKSHPQGLATLSMAFKHSTLGNLFQLPTLMGFPLQSFSPLSWSKDPFESLSPFLHLGRNPLSAFHLCFNGFLP
jgi:hypothetical protein